MIRISILLLCLLSFLHVCAQEEKTIELREVTVEAARVVNKPDGLLLIPTRSIVESSQNGYDLMSQLSLPDIQVDETERTITSLSALGEVQLRINGMVVKQADLLSLDPKLVKNIKLVNRPGVRYGQDIAYVIDINTRRSDSGWGVGVGLQNTFTTYFGNNDIHLKRNMGKSELTLNYINGYSSTRNSRTVSSRDYLLNDGTTYSVRREDIDTYKRLFTQYWGAKYNWADSSTTAFQVNFDVVYNHAPGDCSRYLLTDGTSNIYNTSSNSSSWSPALDLYFSHRFSDNQTLTANATLSSILTDQYSEMDEGGSYAYAVDGKVWRLFSEVIYNVRMKPFAWSSGVQMDWKYTCNKYSGDVDALNGMHQSTLYLFTDVEGNIGNLYYQVGLGASRYRYSQSTYRYARCFFRPKMSLSYAVSKGVQLSYSISHSQHVSRIAMLNDTRIRQNSMEWTVGNPELHASSRLEQTLSFNLNKPRWSNYFSIFSRLNHKPNMAHYERTADNKFLYYQYNQGHINMLLFSNFTQIHILPKHLTLTLQNNLWRVWNKADDYVHNTTFYQVAASVRAHLGKWILGYNYGNGLELVEGETLMTNPTTSRLSIGYHWKNCNLSLSWSHPFEAHPSCYSDQLLNRFVSGRTDKLNDDNGNRLTLNFTWNINKGRRYKSIQRKESKMDTDAGILN